MDTSLICQICKNILSNPRTLRCNHSFCSACLELQTSRSGNTTKQYHCRICGDKTDSQDVIINENLCKRISSIPKNHIIYHQKSGSPSTSFTSLSPFLIPNPSNSPQQPPNSPSRVIPPLPLNPLSNSAPNSVQSSPIQISENNKLHFPQMVRNNMSNTTNNVANGGNNSNQNNNLNSSQNSSFIANNSPNNSGYFSPSLFASNGQNNSTPMFAIKQHSQSVPNSPVISQLKESTLLMNPHFLLDDDSLNTNNNSNINNNQNNNNNQNINNGNSNGNQSFSPQPHHFHYQRSRSVNQQLNLNNNSLVNSPTISNKLYYNSSNLINQPQPIHSQPQQHQHQYQTQQHQNFECSQHNEPIQYFCFSHESFKPICLKCTIDHNGHSVKSIIDCVNELTESNAASKQKLLSLRNNLQIQNEISFFLLSQPNTSNPNNSSNNNNYSNNLNSSNSFENLNQSGGIPNTNNQNIFKQSNELPTNHFQPIQLSSNNIPFSPSLSPSLSASSSPSPPPIFNQPPPQQPLIHQYIDESKKQIKKDFNEFVNYCFNQIDKDFNEYKNSIESKRSKILYLLQEIDNELPKRLMSHQLSNSSNSGSILMSPNSSITSPTNSPSTSPHGSLLSLSSNSVGFSSPTFLNSSNSIPPSPTLLSSPQKSNSPTKQLFNNNNNNNGNGNGNNNGSNGNGNSNNSLIQHFNILMKKKMYYQQLFSVYNDINQSQVLLPYNLNFSIEKALGSLMNGSGGYNEHLMNVNLNIQRKYHNLLKYKMKFIYAIGGKSKHSVERYSIQQNKWSYVASMNYQRNRISSVYDGKQYIYVFGGECPNGFEKSVERYDVFTDKWTMVKEMPKERSRHATVFDGERYIYIIGGKDQEWFSDQVDRFDIQTQEYQPMKSMKMARSDLSAVYDGNGFIYAIGGFNGKALDVMEKYDIKNNKWIRLLHMKKQRDGPGAVFDPTSNHIYVMGGSFGCRKISNNLERVNVNTWNWERLADMKKPIDVRNSAVFDNEGNIYVVGGYYSEVLSEVQSYSIDKNQWDYLEPMKECREGNALTFANVII